MFCMCMHSAGPYRSGASTPLTDMVEIWPIDKVEGQLEDPIRTYQPV